MALNAAQKNELRKLKAECLDKDRNPLANAPTDKLKRIEELTAKAGQPAKYKAAKVRRHTMSDMGRELLDAGGKYHGCRKRGDEVDEYFYRKGDSLPQEAVVVLGGKRIQSFGQTFSDELLAELSK